MPRPVALFLLVAVVSSVSSAQPVEDSFLVRTEPNFTILYDPRVEPDVPLAVEWVEKTLGKATDVYGVALDNENCGLQVMIYGAPTQTSNVFGQSIKNGSAWYEACQKGWNDYQPYGIVRILGASASMISNAVLL